jgi:hypothetical protein
VTLAAPPKILTRQRAWACVAINQLAFPGLGTIMAGRRVGYVQAIVMVAGFCLFVGFMLGFFAALGHSVIGERDQPAEGYYQKWQWALWNGLALTALAWIWALVSSILMLRATAATRIR